MTTIDRQGFQALLVRLVVGIGNITKSMFVIGNSLHKRVVIFAGCVIPATCLGFSDHSLCEIVKRAGIRSGAEQFERQIWPRRSNLIPLEDSALGGRTPHL